MEIAFKGKEAVYNYHLTVPYRPLIVEPGKSIGDSALEGNFIIHGDNLHALKALMPRYASKIDCVFIDPPYNTGNESWSYNDAVNSPPAREWLRQVVDREDMLRHDKWCCMMWPRLKLLWELLSENGTFWMTLDDNEVHHARMLLDEVFGGENFVATVIWHKNYAPKNSARHFSSDHDYLIVYAKDAADWTPRLLQRSEEMEARYKNLDDDPRGRWKSSDLTARNYYSKGKYSVVGPTGKTFNSGTRYWRQSEERFRELDADHRIWWGSDGNNMPSQKRFLSEVMQGKVPQTIWRHDEVGHTQDAKKDVLSIMGYGEDDNVFVTPKPVGLIERIVELSGASLVLDSFAGSGTTAHAVLNANSKDGGDRQFILVESESYADTLTAERVRRVINGYPFAGTRRETLLERNVTWTDVKRAHALVSEVESVQAARRADFDGVHAEIRDGKLRVYGERNTLEMAPGLGGSFAFCRLGDPLDLDKMLSGKALPPWDEVAAWLFHTATGCTLPSGSVSQGAGIDEWYVGESPSYHVWTLYRPDAAFLRSPEAALSLPVAKQISTRRVGKPHLVFAAFRFVSPAQLRPLSVEYAMLPFSLNRLERE